MERKPLYSVQDVADLFEVSEFTVRRWITSGELGAVRLGGSYRIELESLESFWESKGGNPLFTEEGGQ